MESRLGGARWFPSPRSSDCCLNIHLAATQKRPCFHCTGRRWAVTCNGHHSAPSCSFWGVSFPRVLSTGCVPGASGSGTPALWLALHPISSRNVLGAFEHAICCSSTVTLILITANNLQTALRCYHESGQLPVLFWTKVRSHVTSNFLSTIITFQVR